MLPRIHKLALSAAAALAATAATQHASAEEVIGDPAAEVVKAEDELLRAGYRKRGSPRDGLLITSVVLEGVLYGSGLIVAGSLLYEGPQNDEVAPLMIPIAGPFITAMTAAKGSDHPDAKPEEGALLMLNGLGQVAALSMFIAGLSASPGKWVRVGQDIPLVIPGPRSISVAWTF